MELNVIEQVVHNVIRDGHNLNLTADNRVYTIDDSLCLLVSMVGGLYSLVVPTPGHNSGNS